MGSPVFLFLLCGSSHALTPSQIVRPQETLTGRKATPQFIPRARQAPDPISSEELKFTDVKEAVEEGNSQAQIPLAIAPVEQPIVTSPIQPGSPPPVNLSNSTNSAPTITMPSGPMMVLVPILPSHGGSIDWSDPKTLRSLRFRMVTDEEMTRIKELSEKLPRAASSSGDPETVSAPEELVTDPSSVPTEIEFKSKKEPKNKFKKR